MSRSLDPEIIWELQDSTDAADRAIQEYDAAMQKRTNPPKGVIRYVQPIGTDGIPLVYGGLDRERRMKENAENRRVFDQALLDMGVEPIKPLGGYDDREYGDPPVESG